MALRPTVVFAMVPLFNEHLFADAHRRRLESSCDVPDREPLMTFTEPRAALAAGYDGPLTFELLAAEPRPVEEKLAEDVTFVCGVLSEIGEPNRR